MIRLPEFEPFGGHGRSARVDKSLYVLMIFHFVEMEPWPSFVDFVTNVVFFTL